MRHILFFVTSILSTAIAVNLDVILEWNYVDFVWDSPQQKQRAILSGNYNATSCILYDVDVARDGRIFVTSVREDGVPASLMTVTEKMGDGGPLLRPYPNWSWWNTGTCEGITSVYRVFIKCNHLFVLDCGKIGADKVCPAQLLIFDLSSDTLVKRIVIPDDVAANENGASLLTALTVSISTCSNFQNNMVVFMSDTAGFGLVIYNAHSSGSKFCRIESDSMKATDTNFTIDNQSFTLHDGILGLTLVYEDLYYAPLAGRNMYKMNSMKIRECLLSQAKINQITQLTGTLSGQTAAIASQDCAIFFSNIPETSILCADTSKKIDYNNTDVIAKDSVKLQFASGMKVIEGTRHNGGKSSADNSLTILTNRYQRYITDTLDLNEINFRILSANMSEIQNETHCFDSCT
ncbi:hypothetical protein DMN91_005871 [Ooceraea biroi]|uniref:Major royal jelly protein n=1 Tax=Ooceraea biroi TaxID=2015173 RepID=A0A026WDB8_OOCBI|nr:major royal jelly protein 1 [Ooceraea biroi]EZA53636.1 Major royal jelly protein [Ooceraea biroi]RLU21498.1 hypothetical protein DMN91_005871 [Ooceraea biroi]